MSDLSDYGALVHAAEVVRVSAEREYGALRKRVSGYEARYRRELEVANRVEEIAARLKEEGHGD